MLMEMVHVMWYLKVKTKVTANAPARYIWAHYVCGKFLVSKKQPLNPNKHSFLGLILSWDFDKKCPPHP